MSERSVEPGDVLAVHRDGAIVALLDVERHNGTLTEHHRSPEPLEIIVTRRKWTLEELRARMAEPQVDADAAQKWLDDAKEASPAAVEQKV
jgi:hypothetical protein